MKFLNERGYPVRPSKYLLDKVVNLSNTLNFFLSNDQSSRHKLSEKRLVFLAQIDFWEWELETLIYSFSNFKERSKAWVGNPEEMIRKNGIVVKSSALEKLEWQRGSWGNETVAPVEDLNACIDKWNELLSACEQTVMIDKDKLERLNGEFIATLDKYRKVKVSNE